MSSIFMCLGISLIEIVGRVASGYSKWHFRTRSWCLMSSWATVLRVASDLKSTEIPVLVSRIFAPYECGLANLLMMSRIWPLVMIYELFGTTRRV